MARIVRKYGGSSLREPEQIRQVARYIADLKWNGDEVVVVVSAMAATTDELLTLARTLHADPPRREMDMLLSTGERISCALLAMAIEAEGVAAISYTGSQVGIITDTHHGEARIVDVRPTRLLQALEQGQVVVVAGFQGVSVDKEITTLGRGGSDATAIALAAAIKADRCELMKEVQGLHTANPNDVPDADVIEVLDFNSALRLARGGAKALQSEAARLALDHRVPLGIGNTATDKIGTIVTDRPFDCGEILGVARRDRIVRSQGTGVVPESVGWSRLVEQNGRWMVWREAQPNETSTLSGITLVTTGRSVAGLHACVSETLATAEIPVHGIVESQEEMWVCIATDQAANAERLLHEAVRTNGWLKSSNRNRKE
ncbi:aspartate kinase [bacterium]|nr:aspartate kinase [bacterium]